jgi:hypothetical protein
MRRLRLGIAIYGFVVLATLYWTTQHTSAADKGIALAEISDRAANAAQASSTPAGPCKLRAENRQFEFWIGEWDVKQTQSEGGPSVGTSRIESLVSGCIILENWESQGFSGKSWNFFDVGSGKWRQIWLDVTGRKAEFSGEYKDGAMRFQGEAITAKAQKVRSRMTFFNLGPNKVRQFAERSTDDGKTWTTTVDFIYLRKDGVARP